MKQMMHQGALLRLPTAGFRHPANTQKTHLVFTQNSLKKQQKPSSNLTQFQFVMPVLIKDLFMVTASNDQ